MGAVDDLANDLGGWFGEDWVGGLTGQTGAEASLAAAEMQQQTAREALEYQKEHDALARADLQPYTQAGNALLPFYTGFLNPNHQASWLEKNPMFKAALNRGETGARNTLGFSGKRGDLSNAITQNYMATGNQFVQQQLDNIFRGVNLGQASAAGQALQAQNAGNAGANLLTGAGNAGAAGMIGAANAQQAGAGNIATIGAGLLGAFMCDIREKRDLIPLYKDRDRLQVYAFRYNDHDDWYNGKMAQDIRMVDPDHVFEHEKRLYVSAKYAPKRVH